MTMKPFEIQSTALSIGGVTIDTSATGTLVLPGVTRASTSVAIEVDDTGDQTVTWGLSIDPRAVKVIDGYQFAVLNGDPGVTSGGQVGWTPATYAVEQVDEEGYIDGINVEDGGTGYTGEAVTYSQTMFAITMLKLKVGLGESFAGDYTQGTQINFSNPDFQNQDMTGWYLYLDGVFSAIVTAWDPTTNNGQSTGLVFDRNINTPVNNWAFSPADYNPVADFVANDWTEIPFRVRCGAGEIESEFGGGGSGSGLVQRTVNYPEGEDGDTAGTMALDPSGNVYVCTADYVASETVDYSVPASESYDLNQSTNGTDMVVTVLKGEDSSLDSLMNSLTLPSTNWQLSQNSATDGYNRDCVAQEKDSTHWEFTWQFVGGQDNSSFSQDDEFTLFYTAAQPAIWTQSNLGDLYVDRHIISTRRDYIGGESVALFGNSALDLIVQSDTDHSFAEVWLKNGDTSAPTAEINVRAAAPSWGPDGVKTWSFDSQGGLTFPDGTTQTTAYTGQSGSGGGSQQLYIIANADGTVITSTDGLTWTAPIDSGVPVGDWSQGAPGNEGIGKIEVNDGVIVYTRADAGVDAVMPATGMYYSTTLGTATLCYGTATLLGDNLYWNEVHYCADTAKWVAVGWAAGSVNYPVHAYSTNGISWTVLPVDSAFVNSYNSANNNWKLTDVAYNVSEGQYVFVGIMENGVSGAFVTTDVTVPLTGSNFVGVELNAVYITNNPVSQWGGPAGYMMIIPDSYTGFWNLQAPFTQVGSWYSNSDGPGSGWYEDGVRDAFGYIPEISEVTAVGGYFIVTTVDGQVVYTVPAPFLPAVVPQPYTNTTFTISNASPALISFSNGEQTASTNEKIVISDANPSDYNGTYYVDSDNSNALYTDLGMTTAFDATSLAPFVSGTITFSHGTFIDAVGVAGTTLFAGNDDEQVFRSTDYGSNWTLVEDAMDYGAYFNDFAYGLFGGTSSTADLVGDGAINATGQTRVIGTNFEGYQGGESNSLILKTTDFSGFAQGDIVTFRNGEVRTITNVYPDVWDDGGSSTRIEWDQSVGGEMPTNPRYPVTLTTSDYTPATKSTARIKPDDTLTEIGQYMDIYSGAAPLIDDNGHIHMKGHTGNVELFLGTDDNFVSVKEKGTTPASVNLRSENDVTVTESDLKLTRNSSWAEMYGDGQNPNINGYNYDVAHAVITADKFGDYYVGGEHCDHADAYVSKYGRDGSLIWSKYNNSNNVNGWATMALAHNDNEVAAIIRTDESRNNTYAKLVVFDSETGDIKTTTDIYDEDNSLHVRDMIYHSTLGWTVVGNSYGEVGTATGASAIGNSGAGIIEVSGADSRIGGRYPDYSTDWSISGTNISGVQNLNSAGVGLYRDVSVTSVTGSGTGGRLDVRVGYNNTYYAWAYNYVDLGASNNGSGYAAGDQVKIPGSLLGGVNNTPVSGLGNIATGGLDQYSQGYLFAKSTFPTLDTDVQMGDFIVDNTTGRIVVASNSPAAQTYDADTSYWVVYVDYMYGSLSAPAGDVTITRGNDLVCVVTNNDGSFGGFGAMYGKVANSTIRIDMGYIDGSYATADYTNGSFTFTKLLDSRPWVWNNSWSRYFEPPQTNNSSPSGSAVSVAEDIWDGGLVVGGYVDNGTNSGSLVWKLNNNGVTTWAMNIAENDDDVSGVAVSSVDGSVYATTRYPSVTKFNSAGGLLVNVQDDNNFSLYNPVVAIEKDRYGVEHVLVGGRGYVDYGWYSSGQTGFLVTKFDTDLRIVWTRQMYWDLYGISTNYGDQLKNVCFNNGQATLAGFHGMVNRDVGMMLTMDTTDSYQGYESDDWTIKAVAIKWEPAANLDTFDLVTAGAVGNTSSASTADGNGLNFTNWTFQHIRFDLNVIEQSIDGVGGIRFSNGGLLEHNPVDIPPSTSNIRSNWNYTLQLSDRGRFILNQTDPNDSYCENLYITVPSNQSVPFPVGTVITLINSSDSNNSGYEIYVQPENYNNSESPRIYATGYAYNSTWSFQGMQTATLMKISSNNWLLTATNVINRD